MTRTFYNAMLGAAITVETPIDGQTGVWLKEGGVTLSSAMKMTGATVASGQSQMVYNRGVASACIVSSGGSVTVYSGGIARDCADNWRIYVSNGGSADSVTVGANAQCNGLPGGTITNLVVSSNGRFTLQSGSLLSGGTVLAGAAYCWVLDGASAVNVSCYIGRLALSAGAHVSGVSMFAGNFAQNVAPASGIWIGSGASATASNGAWYDGVTITSGGSLVVHSGGTALAVTSNAGAIVAVSSGGYIEYA